jgi:predicted ABC-type exoprotein transport system permease subunit
MFTEGRLYFILFFIVVFIGGLIFAYRKDIKNNPKIFKGAGRILIYIIICLILFTGIVKLLRFF